MNKVEPNNSPIEQEFPLPGDRLNHLLDVIHFPSGRGRVKEFHQYLIDESANYFEDLNYSTVRYWFKHVCPPMRKIDEVIKALQVHHTINHISIVKSWWKIGGVYPFSIKENSVQKSKEMPDVQKLKYVIIGMLTSDCQGAVETLTPEQLAKLKESLFTFAVSFENPECKDIPLKYLHVFMRGLLNGDEYK